MQIFDIIIGNFKNQNKYKTMKFINFFQNLSIKEKRLVFDQAQNDRESQLKSNSSKQEQLENQKENNDIEQKAAREALLMESGESLLTQNEAKNKIQELFTNPSKELFADIIENHDHELDLKDINDLLFYSASSKLEMTYDAQIMFAISQNAIALDQSTTNKLTEKFKESPQDFDLLFNACKSSTSSMDALIRSTQEYPELQNTILEKLLENKDLLSRINEINSLISDKNVDGLSDEIKIAILKNPKFDKTNKTNLINEFLDKYKSLDNNYKQELYQIISNKAGQEILANHLLKEKSISDFPNTMIKKGLEFYGKTDETSFNNLISKLDDKRITQIIEEKLFEGDMKLEQGSIKFNVNDSQRSFKLDEDTKVKLLKAEYSEEVNKIVYTRLLEIVGTLSDKQKAKYSKEIKDYENSNDAMADRIPELDKEIKNKKSAIEQLEEIDNEDSNIPSEIDETVNVDTENVKETLSLQEEIRLSQDNQRRLIDIANGNDQGFNMPSSIARMSEEEIVEKFEDFNGARPVQNILSERNNTTPAEAKEIAAEIIHASMTDNYFKFDDIYEALQSRNLLLSKEKNARTFAQRYQKKSGETPNADMQDFDYCMKLSRALESLTFDKAKTEMAERPKDTQSFNDKELNYEQKSILSNLGQLCNFNETNINTWDDFIGWLTDSKDVKDITLNNLDGTTAYLDEGTFRRHNSPEAALKTLLTDKNLYTIKDGITLWNADAITEKVNKLIKKGLKVEVLGKSKLEDSKGNLDRESKLLDIELAKTNISKGGYTERQMQLFQLGYIVEQESKVDTETAEAQEVLNTGLPAVDLILEQFLQQHAPIKVINEVKEKLIAGAGLEITIKDGQPRISGGGLGTSIELSDGYSLGLGVYANEGGIEAGMGLNMNLYKGDTVEANFNTGLSFGGAGIGFSEKIKGKDLDLVLSQGIGFNFGSLIPTIGGSLGIELKLDGAMERDLESAKEKSDYTEIWEKWKNLKTIDEKINALNEIPKLKELSDELKTTYELSDSDIVHIIEGIEEQLTSEVLNNVSAPIPLFSQVGIAMVGVIPVPYLAFRIGTSEVFIPNRKDLNKLNLVRDLRELSQEDKINEALKELESNETIIRFDESVSEVVLNAEGIPMVITNHQEKDLSTYANTLENYNKALEEVEMSLTKLDNGKVQLNVNATEYKDIEIYIDPEVKDLALIQDGNKILLEGNINNLVITRDRAKFPYKPDGTSSEIRDIIIIRTKDSMEAHTDRSDILALNYGSYLKQDENENLRMLSIGETRYQNNMLEYPGYSTMSDSELTDKQQKQARDAIVEDYAKERTGLETFMSPEEFDRAQQAIKDRNEVVQLDSFKSENFDQAKISNQIEDLYKNKKFKKSLEKAIDNPKEIIKLINSNMEGLNDNERDYAITYLLNKHFTEIAANYEMGPKANKKIAELINNRITEIFKPVLLKQFSQAIERINKYQTSERININDASKLVDQFIDGTYGKLLEDLKNPNFDLKQSKVDLIPLGASFDSVTYNHTKDEEYVPAATIHFRELDSGVNKVFAPGLLEDTITNHDINSEMGRIILEITNPIPQDNVEFINSAFARKVGSLDALYMVMEADEFEKMTEIFKNPQLSSDPNYSQAFNKFKEIALKFREAQLSGGKLELTGRKGLKFEINIDTVTSSGGYSKCANATMYSTEKMSIRGIGKNGQLVAQSTESNETIDHTMGLNSASVGLFGVIKQETIPPTYRKNPKEGPKENKPTPGKQSTEARATTNTDSYGEIAYEPIGKGNSELSTKGY